MCRIIRLDGQKILEITRRLSQRETYLHTLFFNQLAGARDPWLRRLGNRVQCGLGPLRRQVYRHQRAAEIEMKSRIALAKRPSGHSKHETGQ